MTQCIAAKKNDKKEGVELFKSNPWNAFEAVIGQQEALPLRAFSVSQMDKPFSIKSCTAYVCGGVWWWRRNKNTVCNIALNGNVKNLMYVNNLMFVTFSVCWREKKWKVQCARCSNYINTSNFQSACCFYFFFNAFSACTRNVTLLNWRMRKRER